MMVTPKTLSNKIKDDNIVDFAPSVEEADAILARFAEQEAVAA